MKKYIPAIAAALAIAAISLAGPIKVWTNSDILTSTDLNANFAHIHDTMVGGHGARLVDADISGGAAISHSKLATPTLVPKGIFQVGQFSGSGLCLGDAGSCTIPTQAGVTFTVRGVGLGLYQVTMSPALSTVDYIVEITGTYCGGASGCNCSVYSRTSTSVFNIECRKASDNSLVDTGFSGAVWAP